MLGVVAPLLQVPPTFPDKVTVLPAHKVVAPLAEIVEAVGVALTTTLILLEFTLPQPLVLVTK